MQRGGVAIFIPLDVPKKAHKLYRKNLQSITDQNNGYLILFAGDQKIEHLNADFYGKGIAKADNNPKHLFEIAAKAPIGVFATHFGLLARYGMDYRDVPYLVKLNGKTNLIPLTQQDPVSLMQHSVYDILALKESSRLNIVGVGYTIYLGSEFEQEMILEATKMIREAHECGMLAILWIYPQGKAVRNQTAPEIIQGACGVAAALGADYVKVKWPEAKSVMKESKEFRVAVEAAGRTGVLVSGGKTKEPLSFLKDMHQQLSCGAAGSATGRNFHQKSVAEAVRLCRAMHKLCHGIPLTSVLKWYGK